MAFETVYKIGAKGQADVLFRNSGQQEWTSFKKTGFFLLNQSSIYAPNPKQREVLSYIERDGEETGAIPKQEGIKVYQPFDYETEFLFISNELSGEKEKSFNNLLNQFIGLAESSLTLNINDEPIEILNTFTGIRLICYFSMHEVTTTERQKYANRKDVQSVKFTFRVAKPLLCDFVLSDFKAIVLSIDKYEDMTSLYPRLDFEKFKNQVDWDKLPLI